MVVGVVGSSFYSCGRPTPETDARRMAPGAVLAKMGEYEITERLVDEEMKRGSSMYGGLDNLPPSFQLQLQGGVLRSSVANILAIEMAKKYGITASDQDIEKVVAQNIESELGNLKQQYITGGKLKPDATEAQFAELFKKEQGQDLSELKSKALQQNAEMLRTGTDLRIPLASLAVQQPLLDALKKEVKLSDDELKKSYDKLEFKRITLTKNDPMATAKKIETELKGGLTFEKAIDRYSESPADPKEKASEKIEPLERIVIRGFDAYKPLENLKPGEVSAPISIGQSVNIFKLIRIKSDVPKDFDKQKDSLRESQTARIAAGKLQTDLQEAQKTAKIEWKVKAYEWLYAYGRLTAENLGADERAKLERQIMEESLKSVTEGDAAQAKLSSLLAYVTFESVYGAASAAEKIKLDDTKVKVYEAYLLDHEDPAMRLELVKVYQRLKKAEEYNSQLNAAANANLGSTDAAAQGRYSEINTLIREGEGAKLLTAEQAADLRKIQTLWVEQKAEQDKFDAEQKKLEEEERKKAEAEEKKAQAEAAKNVKTREELEKEKKAKAGGTK